MVKDHVKLDPRLNEYDPTVGDVCYRFSLDAIRRFFDNPGLCYALLAYFWAKGKELPDDTFLNRCNATPDFNFVYRLFVDKAMSTLQRNSEEDSIEKKLLTIVQDEMNIGANFLH